MAKRTESRQSTGYLGGESTGSRQSTGYLVAERTEFRQSSGYLGAKRTRTRRTGTLTTFEYFHTWLYICPCCAVALPPLLFHFSHSCPVLFSFTLLRFLFILELLLLYAVIFISCYFVRSSVCGLVFVSTVVRLAWR